MNNKHTISWFVILALYILWIVFRVFPIISLTRESSAIGGEFSLVLAPLVVYILYLNNKMEE